MGGQAARGSDSDAKARILVVDDNEDNRDMLSRRLKRKGYECLLAPGGEEALASIADGGIDLVLLDVMMPGMSGVECLQKIRENHPKTRLPVIMATAKTDSKSVVEALGGGANDYVTKPIDFPVLLARLESHLSIREEAAEASEEAKKACLDLSRGIPEGTVVDDRYEILGMIGHGGFATVYRAKQLSTEQIVAFKCLSPDRVARDPSSVEVKRFAQEMKAIGAIDHPNVVRLIDSGRIEVRVGSPSGHGASWSEAPSGDQNLAATLAKTPTADKRASQADPISSTQPAGESAASSGEPFFVPYIVMDFLEGETLSELLTEEKKLEAARAVDLMLPILSALSAAHEEGIVHRDVKPGNVFLVAEKGGGTTPKILDFGIAKLVERSGEALTVDDSFIGTPEYMSPEQGRGERDIDPRADQFSVAAMLYHALTGRKLYVASSFIGLVRRVSEGDFTPPSELVDDLPPGLEDVLLRALDRDRDRRFSSVVSFGKALLPFATEATRRMWQDRLAHPTDPPPPARPQLVTKPDAPAAAAGAPLLTSRPPALSRPSQDTTVKHPTPSERPKANTAVAPEQPPMWMWFILLATLAGIGAAAASFGF